MEDLSWIGQEVWASDSKRPVLYHIILITGSHFLGHYNFKSLDTVNSIYSGAKCAKLRYPKDQNIPVLESIWHNCIPVICGHV